MKIFLFLFPCPLLSYLLICVLCVNLWTKLSPVFSTLREVHEIENEIQEALDEIERKENVRVLFACESGSRAWGFPSDDSDWDVRFLYAHHPEWYLRVFPGRDVIEKPVTELLDVSGWDLKKALELLRKSNPALREWLSCPLIYRENSDALKPLRTLADNTFNPLASCHHYLSAARNHVLRDENASKVKLKNYLYCLRPLLSAQWVIERRMQPPMRFQEAVEALIPGGEIREVIEALLVMKTASSETDCIPRIEVLDRFLREQFSELETQLPLPGDPVAEERFNEAFRETLSLLT